MRAAGLALLLAAVLAGDARSQELPFAPGERFTYQARVAKLGRIGTATMWVDGPETVRGQSTYHLRFEIDSKVGFVRVLNVSESWLDALRMTSVRFHKRERHPLSKREESVEVFPDEQRWQSAEGGGGRTLSEQPLDELSFIYFLRTVVFEPGGAMRFDRHFEVARNPTLVRVVGREVIETPAGRFSTIVVEMQVRDGRYGGNGAIRLHLSDDARRIPVRMESAVPLAGKAVLTLQTYTQANVAGRKCATSPAC